MALSNSINCSKNALVIHLDQVLLEDIVDEKLKYFLNQKPLLCKNILKFFYQPVEQALIGLSLEQFKGNQLKTAQSLGINRNTLKKKIISYNLNVKKLITKPKTFNFPTSRVFLSSISSLDLFEVCSAKLNSQAYQKQWPEKNILKYICQPVEKKIIQRVLEHFKGNQIQASRFLGINRNTIKKKINFNQNIRAVL